jgi:hypothetical protein
VWHIDVSQNSDFACATQSIYHRYFPSHSSNQCDPLQDKVGDCQIELEQSPAFDRVRSNRHAWPARYHSETYLRLLLTFSDVGALATDDRARFIDAIKTVVGEFGGVVEKRYETVMLTARRI